MRYLVISDIHANLPALAAVLETATWDRLLCLGDAIVTGPQPAAVVDRLAAHPGIFLEGNHDTDPWEDGHLEPDRDPDDAWLRWTRERLRPRHRRFVREFEPTHAVTVAGTPIRLHHGDFAPMGLPASFDGRLWPDSPDAVFRGLADRYAEATVLHGHAHIQFRRYVNGTTFINPGSVGAPRLGEPVAAYAILEGGDVSLRSVPYDVAATCQALADLPLPAEFIDTWQAAIRTGTLPDRYDLRDFTALRSGGAL